MLDEALEAAREAGDTWRTSTALTNLAAVALLAHRWPEAEAYAEQALATAPDDYGRAAGLHSLALARMHLGRPEEATPLLVEVAMLAGSLGDLSGIAECLQAFAAIELRAGRWDRAARLLGAAEATMESVNASHAQVERELNEHTLAGVRARIGDDELRRALADGRALDPDAALALAIDAHVRQPGRV